MSDLLIRVDATPETALGHLKRCISLAEALRDLRIEPLFLCAGDTGVVKGLVGQGFEFVFSETSVNIYGDSGCTLEFMKSRGVSTLVIDSYRVDQHYLGLFQKERFTTICLDDLADRPLPCDMVINGSLGAEELIYDAPQQLLGSQYCILGRPFWSPQTAERENAGVKNVLITMGGIDHYGLSQRCMKLLDQFPDDFGITVIVGPFYDNWREIQQVAANLKRGVEVVIGSNDLHPYMQTCDLAISAGGFTLYELATLKKPTVGIGLGENQHRNVVELDKRKAITGLIYEEDPSFDQRLSAFLARMIRDPQLRSRMAQRAGELIDGQGAVRVASEIKDLVLDGKSVRT